MASLQEIMQVCRLCLVSDQVNVPIFDGTSDIRETFAKISSCLPVKVSKDDNLPKKICEGCSYKLDLLYDFRNTSVSSEKQLLQWLQQIGVSSGIPTTAVSSGPNATTQTNSDILVKQESFEHNEGAAAATAGGMSAEAQSYIMQQQKLPYRQEFPGFGESSTSTSEPPPKRARRAAAMKAPIAPETDSDEDDLDNDMTITKAESDDDSDEPDQPSYVDATSTSVDDQPGPSGVGKPSVEASIQNLTRQDYTSSRASTSHKSEDSFREQSWQRSENIPSDVNESKTVECPTVNVASSTTKAQEPAIKRVAWIIGNTYTCTTCSKRFLDHPQLMQHIKLCHAAQFTCEKCNEKFSDGNYFCEHIKAHKNIDQQADSITVKVTSSTTKTLQTVGNKTPIKRVAWVIGNTYTCTTCCRRFLDHPQLMQHIKRCHVAQFTCEKCNEKFFDVNSFCEHIRDHNNVDQQESNVVDSNESSRSTDAKARGGADGSSAAEGKNTFGYVRCWKETRGNSGVLEYIIGNQGNSADGNANETVESRPVNTSLVLDNNNKSSISSRRNNAKRREPLYPTGMLAWTHIADAESPFSCTSCFNKFESYFELIDHVKSVHRMQFICEKCNEKFFDEEIYSFHMSQHYKDSEAETKSLMNNVGCIIENDSASGTNFRKEVTDRYTCPPKEYIKLVAWLFNQSEYIFKCTTCWEEFETRSELLEHIKTNHVEQFTCQGCVEKFFESHFFLIHIRQHYGDTKGKSLPTILEENLDHDQKLKLQKNTLAWLTDATESIFACTTCQSLFHHRAHLLEHIRISHLEKYICEECNLKFMHVQSYSVHMLEYHKFATITPNEDDVYNEEHVAATSDDVENIFTCTTCSQRFQEEFRLLEHFKKSHAQLFLEGHNFIVHISRINKEGNSDSSAAVRPNEATIEVKPAWIEDEEKHIFICTTCKDEFQGKIQLVEHFVADHEDQFVCEKCNRIFAQRYLYSVHMHQHDSEVKFELNARKQTDKVNDREQTDKVNAGKKSVKKRMCKAWQLQRTRKTYKCTTCFDEFPDKSKVFEHIRESHSDEFACEECNKKYDDCTLFSIHMSQHNSFKTFACPLCDFVCDCCTDIGVHVKETHRIYCNLCSKLLTSVDSFKAHNQSEHADVNPHVCEVCGKGFSAESSLYTHQVCDHHVVNAEVLLPTQCIVCWKTFSTVSKKDVHIRDRHAKPDDKRHLCDLCGKGFYTSSLLNSHMRVHSEERPFVCHFCGKNLRTKKILSNHILIHTGEKPFTCEHCGEQFNRHTSYSNHVKRHTGERPHSCKVCNKGFITKQARNSHEMVCTNKKLDQTESSSSSN